MDDQAKIPQTNPQPAQVNPPDQTVPTSGRGGGITSWLTVLMLLIFGGGLLAAVIFEAPVIERLNDPAFTRGLITWVIVLATIGIAFVLIYQAFFSLESSDDRFRRGREIFTGLMGVLGTIVGFYFGSAEKPGTGLEVAAIRLADKQLISHISGGTRPYRYSVTSTEKDFTQIKKVSDDGWVTETLPQVPQPSSTLTIDVVDGKDQKASRKIDIPSTAKVPAPEPQPQPPK